MTRWLIAAWVLLLTGLVCLAQVPTTGAGLSGPANGFSLTYEASGQSSTTGTTTISYGTLTWGSSCNAVVAAVQWYNTAKTDTVALTIGGSSASVISNTTTSPANGGITVSLLELTSPSGSSGAVSATFSENVTYTSSVALYCLVSAATTVSSSNSVSSSGAVASQTLAITIPSGGAALVAGASEDGFAITWTNATQDVAITTGGVYESYAHANASATVTSTPSSNDTLTISYASFGP